MDRDRLRHTNRITNMNRYYYNNSFPKNIEHFKSDQKEFHHVTFNNVESDHCGPYQN